MFIVKWALENKTTNKASGGDGIPVELRLRPGLRGRARREGEPQSLRPPRFRL